MILNTYMDQRKHCCKAGTGSTFAALETRTCPGTTQRQQAQKVQKLNYAALFISNGVDGIIFRIGWRYCTY